MNLQSIDRREFLAAGSATLTSAAMAGAVMASAAMATAALGATLPSSAAASGTLRLGDIRVNRLGFGAMRITGDGIWGEPDDARSARAVLHRALDLGVNFIDTADAYGPNVSERLIAEALHPYAAGLVIATKGGMVRSGPNQWQRNARPEHLRAACDASLQRLKLNRIDVYQLHAVDPAVPLEDSIGELARLQSAGKIRHIGVSNFSVEQLQRAQKLVNVVSVQNRYNVADRNSDDVLHHCEREKIAFIPWSPLAQRQQAAGTDSGAMAALQRIAAQRHISLSQATLAWLLARSPVMLPIPGTSSVAHLEDNVAAASIHLTTSEMAQAG